MSTLALLKGLYVTTRNFDPDQLTRLGTLKDKVLSLEVQSPPEHILVPRQLREIFNVLKSPTNLEKFVSRKGPLRTLDLGEASKLKHVDLAGSVRLESLDGFEHLKMLQYLNISKSNVDHLNPIGSLKQLE